VTTDWHHRGLTTHVPGIVDGHGDNLHDDPVIMLNMLITDPRCALCGACKAGKASINGVSIADSTKSVTLAKTIVAFRAEKTVEAIGRASRTNTPSPHSAGRAHRSIPA